MYELCDAATRTVSNAFRFSKTASGNRRQNLIRFAARAIEHNQLVLGQGRVVMPCVRGFSFDFQIVWVVVCFILVLVMNFFPLFQKTSDLIFHQHTMQRIKALRIPFGVQRDCSAIPVSPSFADSNNFKHRGRDRSPGRVCQVILDGVLKVVVLGRRLRRRSWVGNLLQANTHLARRRRRDGIEHHEVEDRRFADVIAVVDVTKFEMNAVVL
jgi:hypothetical protein